MSSQGALESSPAASVIQRRGMPPFAPPPRLGYAIGDDVDEEADEIDPDFDPDDDVTPASTSAYAPDLTSTSQVTMRDPEPTSRKRKAPPAPRPKRRRKTKAAPVEPVLSEYELGRRAKIKRNNKFLVSVGLLFPPCVRGVPRCCGAFTPSMRLASISQ